MSGDITTSAQNKVGRAFCGGLEEFSMKLRATIPPGLLQFARELTATVCVAAIAYGSTLPAASQTQAASAAADQTANKIPPDQLDSLVAPIALYPDPMLS